MKKQTEMKTPHVFAAIGLSLLGLVAIFGIVAYQTMLLTQSATVGNTDPTIGSGTSNICITTTTSGTCPTNHATSLTPVDNSDSATYYARITVTDLNGCQEHVNTTGTDSFVTSPTADWTIKLFHSSTSQAACTSSDNYTCYVLASTTNSNPTSGSANLSAGDMTVVDGSCTGSGDTTFDVFMPFKVKYYAKASTDTTYWTMYANMEDDGSGATAGSTGADSTLDVAGTTALTLQLYQSSEAAHTGIAFGSVALGQHSPGGTTATTSHVEGTDTTTAVRIKNSGNVAFTPTIVGSGAMTCTGTGSDSIVVGNVKYSTTNGFDYAAAGTALTTTAANLSAIAVQTTSTISKSDVFVKIKIPASGVFGTCSNTVTLSTS